MLAKLIKYDLKFILKSVSVYIITLLICSLLFNATSYENACTSTININCNEIPITLQILHTIFWNALIAILIGLVLNAVIRTWARYKNNFFHDEAYLTHTLPIKRQTLWLAKFLSGVATCIIVIAAIALSFIILGFTDSGKNFIATFGIGSLNSLDGTPIFYIIYIFTVFAQLLYATICGFTGITIGNRANNHRGLRAILIGFAVYLIGAVFALAYIQIWGNARGFIDYTHFNNASLETVQVFNPDFDPETYMLELLFGVSVIYTLLITALYFVNNKLLKKGINLD